MKINVRIMKRMAFVEPNLVKHFIRTSARMYGQIALREQFNLESVEGFTGYNMVELDHVELVEKITSNAKRVADALCRLDAHAMKRGYGTVCMGLVSASLSDVITCVNSYLEQMVADSDYAAWINEAQKE